MGRPRDAAASREALLRAAQNLFGQQGFEGTTIRDALEKSKHAMYFRHPVQLSDQVNFRSTGIREACFHPSGGQRAKKTFCSVHRRGCFILSPHAVENTSSRQENLRELHRSQLYRECLQTPEPKVCRPFDRLSQAHLREALDDS